MAGVNTFDWRRRTRSERHTTEVRSEHLPEAVRQAIALIATRTEALETAYMEMAQQVADANMRAIEVEKRLAVIEAAMAGLAAEAKKRMGQAA